MRSVGGWKEYIISNIKDEKYEIIRDNNEIIKI